MRVWSLIIITVSVYGEVVGDNADGSGCPRCAEGGGGECQYRGAVRDECYYLVRGRAVTVQARGQYYQLQCGGIQLDEQALPRLTALRIVPALVLDGCELPANTSLQHALRNLNVAVLDDLVLTNVRGGGELPARLLTGLSVRRLTVTAADRPPRPLVAAAALLSPLCQLSQLRLTAVSLPIAALLSLPPSLQSLHVSRCNLTALPAAALRRLPRLWRLVIDESLLTAPPPLSSAPALTALILSAPLTVAPPLHTLINATLSGVSDVRLEGGCGRLQRLSVVSAPLESLSAGWLPAEQCAELLELHVQRLPRLHAVHSGALLGGRALRSLAVTDCPLLTALPYDLLLPLRNLHSLDLSRNSLQALSDGLLSPLTALRRLDVSGNQLSIAAAYAVAALTPLQYLAMDRNPLGDLCPEADDTLVSQYRVISLSPLSPLTSLHSLSLSVTGQQRVCGDWRRQFTALEELRLRGNKIAALQDDDYQWQANNVTVQLQDNPIQEVTLSRGGYERLQRPPRRNAALQLNVALHCDCRHYWLARGLQRGELPARIDGLQCRLDAGGAMPVHRADLQLMVCEEVSSCPSECRCEWRAADDTLLAACSGDSLPQFRAVSAARLELSLCCVRHPDLDRVRQLPAVTRRVLLVAAQLQSAAALLSALSPRNVTLQLAHNPLHCDCNELTALHQYRLNIEDFANATCSDGRLVSAVLPAVYCGGSVVVPLLPGLAAGALLAGVLVLLLQRPLRGRFKRWLRRRQTKTQHKRYVYDGFLAFSYQDTEFAQRVIAALESGDQPLRLCVHYRDWPAGCWLPAAVQRSVAHSRRTVALVSQSFAAAVWTRHELRQALARHSIGLGARPVVVVLERRVPPALRRGVRGAHCIRHDDPRLWDQLRRLLRPHNVPPGAGHTHTTSTD